MPVRALFLPKVAVFVSVLAVLGAQTGSLDAAYGTASVSRCEFATALVSRTGVLRYSMSVAAAVATWWRYRSYRMRQALGIAFPG